MRVPTQGLPNPVLTSVRIPRYVRNPNSDLTYPLLAARRLQLHAVRSAV